MATITQTYASALSTAWLFVLLLLPLGAEAQNATVRAFGTAISAPATAPSGQILARQPINTNQLCDDAQCDITALYLYPYGHTAVFDMVAIPTTVPGVNTQLVIKGAPKSSNIFSPPISISSPIEVQLVSTGGGVNSGTLHGSSNTDAYFTVAAKNPRSGVTKQTYILLTGQITAIQGTCTVTTPPVTLPPISTARLPTVGSTSGGAAFTMNVDRCPAGYNRVGYTLTQSTASPQAPPGVLQSTTDSSARGVKIQLKDSTGTGLHLNRSYQVNEYRKASGGSYKIPLRADYYRTESIITPGTVKADVTVSLDYQ